MLQKQNLYYSVTPIFFEKKKQKGNPLEKEAGFSVEKKLTKVKWETPKEDNEVFA